MTLMMTGKSHSTDRAGRPDFAGLTADSRDVRPGYLFAALPGRRADGRGFIADAVARGATAVLAPPGTVLPAGADAVRLIEDDQPRRRFAQLAAAFYGRQPEVIAAVTGTNGKTSTVHFTRQMWRSLGYAAASLGTLGIEAQGLTRGGALTTPDPVVLHASLADLADGGVTHLAMEASSHGLDQFRLDGVRVGAAGFTNLSHDHLDYHGTMAAYLAAKARLFTDVLAPDGTLVLNADAPEATTIARQAWTRGRALVTYGRNGRTIRLEKSAPLAHGTRLNLIVEGRRCVIVLPLVGEFQALNALCALGLVMAGGVQPIEAVATLGRLQGVRGRLERVARHPNGAPIYVDYAHTPDALKTVLTALRPHTKGQLICVFGCGGDRDREKRPVMGSIARLLADRAVVTDDNPRTEPPDTIRSAILAACPDALEIGDRAEAIATAIRELGPTDVLVIAGKGHETGQQVGSELRPFDDAEVARAAVAELGGEAP